MTGGVVPVVLAQESVGGGQIVEAMILGVVLLMIVSWVGKTISRDDDRDWLQRFIVWGFIAKLVGAGARYWMVTGLYETGDSLAYHEIGQLFARQWRSLVVPISDASSPGTAFTEVVTGFIYAIYTPTLLGGFLMFATLSFIGQILFYSAFRPWMSPDKKKLYALAVFFFPSLVFWPSSVGKDALMVLFLGLAAYGCSVLLRTYRVSSVLLIAPGLYLASGIRPHVAGILGIALVLAVFFGKSPPAFRGSPKRAVMLLVAVVGAVAVLAAFGTTFNVSVEGGGGSQDLNTLLSDVSEQTGQGGSEIEGGAISSPSQLPLAVITVLFRPLIHEGTSAQVLASALEGTALLALIIWKLPTMWRNKRLLRERAYILLCFFYTGGFVIGFSAVLNLGILARQRVQVLPFFLAAIVALGWPEPKPEPEVKPEPDVEKRPLTPRRPPGLVTVESPRLGAQKPVADKQSDE